MNTWPSQDWKIDVLACDGALQFLLLWGYARLQCSTLPVGFSSIKFYQKEIPSTELLCEFSSEIVDSYRTRSDILLLTQDGRPYVELRGVEMCVVGSGTGLFIANS